MTAVLLLHKPADPCKFLAEYLTGLQKQGAQPALTREELRVMFGMFDVTEKGVVSVAQANQVNFTCNVYSLRILKVVGVTKLAGDRHSKLWLVKMLTYRRKTLLCAQTRPWDARQVT